MCIYVQVCLYTHRKFVDFSALVYNRQSRCIKLRFTTLFSLGTHALRTYTYALYCTRIFRTHADDPVFSIRNGNLSTGRRARAFPYVIIIIIAYDNLLTNNEGEK